MNVYWWLWWKRQDRRAARFVARALREVETVDVLYLHPNGEKPATHAIVKVENVKVHHDNHDHLAGR